MENYIGGTPDGRLWLMKALDPAGQSVDVRGMPDVENHNCAVLNYQTQTQMSAPNLYKLDPSNNITYDADLYLYQHPIIFGAGVTYPSGTVDPLEYDKRVILEFGGSLAPTPETTEKDASPSISFQTGGRPLFPRTPFVAQNEELGTDTIPDTVEMFQKVAQRHRIIYGAAQLVPTCSANDNSGSISVSQTVLTGDRSGHFNITPTVPKEDDIADAAGDITLPLDYFEEGDFPEERMIMQNPKALITRFYEGSYIPYKLPNPLETNFINTGQLHATRTPFWVIGAQAANDINTWVPLTWDYESQAFITPKDATGSPKIQSCVYLRIDYLTKTGQTGFFIFKDGSETQGIGRFSCKVTVDLQDDNLLGKKYSGALNVYSGNFTTQTTTGAITVKGAGKNNALTTFGTYGQCAMIALPLAPIVSTHMSGLNFKGNIKVMIRMGVELVCNIGSLYMPMVHISPAYDDAAIKNYIRVTHQMRDAFYGNAAAPEFRQQYMNNLLSVLWAPYLNVDFANRGASWTGQLAAR